MALLLSLIEIDDSSTHRHIRVYYGRVDNGRQAALNTVARNRVAGSNPVPTAKWKTGTVGEVHQFAKLKS